MSYFYREGNIGIIILALHDGKQKEDKHFLKKRPKNNNKKGPNKVVLVNDTDTRIIASKTTQNISNLLGEKPYLLINNIHRKYLDLNRPIEEGTYDDRGKYYWYIFHNKLHQIIKKCKKKYGHCLLLDIHGNIKTHNLIELGYGIGMISIEKHHFKKSSLDYLKNYYPLKSLIIGKRSLGNFLDDFLDTAPGPILYNSHLIKTKAKDLFYYNGGYVTRTYSEEYSIDAIQIELSRDLRNKNKFDYISNILAKGIYAFYQTNYKF
jgi:hypothetical protein